MKSPLIKPPELPPIDAMLKDVVDEWKAKFQQGDRLKNEVMVRLDEILERRIDNLLGLEADSWERGAMRFRYTGMTKDVQDEMKALVDDRLRKVLKPRIEKYDFKPALASIEKELNSKISEQIQYAFWKAFNERLHKEVEKYVAAMTLDAFGIPSATPAKPKDAPKRAPAKKPAAKKGARKK